MVAGSHSAGAGHGNAPRSIRGRFAEIAHRNGSMDIQQEIRTALEIEYTAIQQLADRIDDRAEAAVRLIHQRKGRVIITGMGKAGIIGRKMAGTFTSTGTPAQFLHPAEATHGDLGMVRSGDVIIAVSNSGETEEIVALLPHLKGFDVSIIAMTGNPESTLARNSVIVIDTRVEREADPMGVAPTASTTVALAMGDALAAALVSLNAFTKDKYAVYHPGGSLGRALLFRVRDLMHRGDRLPRIDPDSQVRDAIMVMSSKRMGAVFVAAPAGPLEGILTDGDLRRVFERETNPLERPVSEVMTRHPHTVRADVLALDALRLMEDHAITVLPVIDDSRRPVAALHMHDLVQAGLALWPAATD